MQKNEQIQSIEQVGNVKKENLTRKIVLTAVFTALATVVNSFVTIRVGPIFKFSPLLVIYFFAGYYLGAPLGFCVGLLGDIFGWLIFTDGAYNPFIGLSNGLCCAIPGLMFGLKRPCAKPTKYGIFVLKSFIAFVVCYLLCTVFITSSGIWIITAFIRGKYETLIAWFVYRATVQGPNNLVNFVMVILLYLPLRKIKYLERQIYCE